MPAHPFDTDDDGTIITYPLAGWKSATAWDTSVLLRLEYLETSASFQSGQRSALQVTLSPKYALALAAELTTLARAILDAPAPDGPRN